MAQTFDINRFRDDRIKQLANGLFAAVGYPNEHPTYGQCLKALRQAERDAGASYGGREPK